MLTIVFTCDNNFFMPTCVAAVSVMEHNSSNLKYRFLIVLSEHITKDSIALLNRLKKKYPTTCVEYMEAGDFLKNAVVRTGYINSSTYLRLFIPWLIKDDICLFLDSDVIVNCDLEKLWQTDITNVFFSGVLDYGFMSSTESKRMKAKELELDIESFKYYYAGVALLNLKKMRENNLYFSFVACMEKGYSNEDQDVLNKCCQNAISTIPLRYNFMNRYIGMQSWLDRDVYSDKEIKETIDGQCIIHYIGENKPWRWMRCKGLNEWISCAEKFLDKKEMNDLSKGANNYSKTLSWRTLRERCDKYDKIIVCGYTANGKKIVDSLLQNGYNIIAICDKKAQDGQKYKDIPILKIENIILHENVLMLNVCMNASKDIDNTLKRHGVDEGNIYHFRWKTISHYYQSLRTEEYKSELREIYYQEYGDDTVFDNLGYQKAKASVTDAMIEKYDLKDWLLYNG